MDQIDARELFAPSSPEVERYERDVDERENREPGGDDDDRSRDRAGGDDEAIEVPAPKEKDAAAEDELKKKRIIRNPMPKLNPDRITGVRGVGILPDVFKGFKSKGAGHEYSDLDEVMKKMEHWAHRLYPKLPFDDVTDRIAVLGKKQAVKTYVKKMRTGMVEEPIKEIGGQETGENESGAVADDEDEVQRYGDNPDAGNEDDVFQRLMREADEREEARAAEANAGPTQSQNASTTMTEEQRERMLRNRQIAEEKRKARLAQSQSQDSTIISANPSETTLVAPETTLETPETTLETPETTLETPESTSATPGEAEIPLSQDSTQEESSEKMEENDDGAHNTSEARLAQSQSQASTPMPTNLGNTSWAIPAEAENPLSQDSTQESKESQVSQESQERMEESDDEVTLHNTSEVRVVPECDEDDDVIIPFPDDDGHRVKGSGLGRARDQMEVDTQPSSSPPS